MKDLPPTTVLTEAEARDVVNGWSEEGFFRLRNMGDKIFFGSIQAGAAYVVRLQTHYEQRRTHRTSEPYHGGPVDDRGPIPDRWRISVGQPRPFEERTETLPVPHTERVQVCGECAGEGRVRCPGCAGQGRIRCISCGGMGYIDQQILEPNSQFGNQGGPNIRTIRRPCSCLNGVMTCPGCGGNGIIRCRSCQGSGQVKTYDVLVVRFQNAKQGEVLDVTPVPDNWLGSLSGESLFDRKAPRIDESELDPISEPFTIKARDLLRQSHDIDEKHERILVQMLHIDRIALQEVKYTYAGVDRTLWICGKEKGVYAPNAPWNRSRLFFLITGSVLAAAGIITWITYLFMR